LDSTAFPEQMVSASDFIAPVLPAIPPGWIEAADTPPGRFSGFADAAQGNLLWALEADLERFGLEGAHAAVMSDWLSVAWDRGDFHPPSAFATLGAARHFVRQFGPTPAETLVLGLALRAEDVDRAAEADDGITSVSRLPGMGDEPEPGGDVLGFDVYGVGGGELRAWIRARGAVKRMADAGIRPNGCGLLTSLEDAVDAAARLGESGGAWFAWRVTSYPLLAD